MMYAFLEGANEKGIIYLHHRQQEKVKEEK